MNSIKIYLKDIGAAVWNDITGKCTQTQFKLRKGFGDLGSTSDVSKLSIEYRADDLASAVLFHTSAKQIKIERNGVTVFEGYTEGDAKVRSTATPRLAWVKLDAYPYAKKFDQVIAAEDMVFEGKKICDPADPANSLVHILTDLIYEGIADPYRTILSTVSQRVQTDVSIKKVLPVAVLEAETGILQMLDDLLGEYGLARYMEQSQLVIVEPYAENALRPVRTLAYNDILAHPDISTAPYIVDEKTVVTLGRISEAEDQIVYTLYGEDGEGPGKDDVITRFYPEDGDLSANYGTEDETDYKELYYATGLTYTYKATYADNSGPATIEWQKAVLGGTSATFKGYNANKPLYLNDLQVHADKVYYKDTSQVIEDSTITSRNVNELESVYMVDSADAEHYIKTYRAEVQARKFRMAFKSDKITVQPNELIRIGDIAFTVLARYIETDLISNMSQVDCVAYDVRNIQTDSKVESDTATGGVAYINLVLDGTAYTYDSKDNLKPAEQLLHAEVRRFGTIEKPVWIINGVELPNVHDLRIEVPADLMQGRTNIEIMVKVGKLTARQYIYKITDGADYPPIVEYRYSHSPTEPYSSSAAFTIGSSLLAAGSWAFGIVNNEWFKEVPKGEQYKGQYLWKRTWNYELQKWMYERITGDQAQLFSIKASSSTYSMSSRSYVTTEQLITFTAELQNVAGVPSWSVSDGFSISPSTGLQAVVSVPRGATATAFVVTCSIEGYPAQTLRINGVLAGEPEPLYMHVVDMRKGETYPTETPDGPLMVGDHVLVIFEGQDPQGNKQIQQRPDVWTGSAGGWIPVDGKQTPNYSLIMSHVLGDALKSSSTAVSVGALFGYFKELAAESAFIANLVAHRLQVGDGTDLKGFRFEVSEYDAQGNKRATPLWEVRFDGNIIFMIDAEHGRVYFGEPNPDGSAKNGFVYDQRNKTIASANKNFIVEADTGKIISTGADLQSASLDNCTINSEFDAISIQARRRVSGPAITYYDGTVPPMWAYLKNELHYAEDRKYAFSSDAIPNMAYLMMEHFEDGHTITHTWLEHPDDPNAGNPDYDPTDPNNKPPEPPIQHTYYEYWSWGANRISFYDANMNLITYIQEEKSGSSCGGDIPPGGCQPSDPYPPTKFGGTKVFGSQIDLKKQVDGYDLYIFVNEYTESEIANLPRGFVYRQNGFLKVK